MGKSYLGKDNMEGYVARKGYRGKGYGRGLPGASKVGSK